MSAIDATFGVDAVVNCCGRVLQDSHLPRTIGRLLKEVVEDSSSKSSILFTLPLGAQEFIVLLASSLFMFGARLVHEADMLLVIGASVRKPPCGLTHGALTT